MIRAGSCVILLLAASEAAAQAPLQTQPEPGATSDAAAPASAQTQPEAADARAPAHRIALLPTHTSGVDPAVARFVDRALQRAATALGYVSVDGAQASAGATEPLALAELWRLTHRLDVEIGVSVLVSASGGLYQLQLRLASRDGRGPFHARAQASHLDLEPAVERLLTTAAADRAASAPPPAQAPSTSTPAPAPALAPAPPAAPAPALAPAPAPAPAAEPASGEPALPATRLALHNDLAFGLADDPFVNEVVGVRADLRLDTALWLGLHIGYANLPGREGRVHGALPYAQIEQRIALGTGRALAIPLRLGLGYLLRNGGFLRLSSGLAIPLGARSELVLDLLAPAFWTTPDKTLFSLAAGAELAIEL